MTTASEQVEDRLDGVLGVAGLETGAREAGGRPAPCRIATYTDQPVAGAFTLVTLGLSDTPVRGPRSEAVRQELLLCAWDRHRQDGLYEALFAVARLLGDEGETFDPGAVLPAPETAAEELVGHSFFIYPPVYHPEELQDVRLGNGEEVEILWLVPITAPEADFVEANGPEAFQDMLAQTDPDLLDLERPCMVGARQPPS